MGALPLDITATRAELSSVTSRVAGLCRTQHLERPVPGLAWSVGDLVAHLVTITEGIASIASGESSPDDFWATYAPDARGHDHTARAALNDGLLNSFDRAEMSQASDRIESAVTTFLDHTAGQPPDAPFRYIDGDRDVATVTAVALAELSVHGWDLAHALGQRWPINPAAARLALAGAASMVPDHFDVKRARGLNVTADMRIRGGPRFGIALDGEGLTVLATPPHRPDFHVSADPVTYLLVSYGRKSQWMAAARGQTVAWGRRPWLAIRMSSLIDKP